MPVGRSGRIVVELDPDLKRRLHARLRGQGLDFKAWLLERVQEYLGAPREGEGAPPKREEPPSACGEVELERGEVESELGEIEKRVLEALSAGGPAQHPVDRLLEATGLGVGEVQGALLQLELHGLVVQHLGLYRRVRPS
jgi:predicted Rossmann fold nucleotide-binding protein DprA/Smf involved in DNA uptake